ncbi:MAG: sensor histidine kinase, partial [Gemmatimonadales bacterium]
MASIRTRITSSYALAFAGTMFAFSAVVWAERRAVAQQDLRDRATLVADLAVRLLRASYGVDLSAPADTVRPAGRDLTTRYKPLLDALPGYLIIGEDSANVVYQSPQVRALSDRDIQTLTGAAFSLRARGDSVVTLDDQPTQVLLVARFEPSSALRRVIAGVSTQPLDVAGSQVLFLALVIGPMILLISAATAWTLAGRLLRPIEQMVNDVEAISDGRSLHRRIPVEDLGDEIGRLGSTLNAMIGRLETSFAALRRFTADASHELKTPLTVLRADIERAMTTGQGSTEQLVALEEALQESARMADLVESLLTLARADEGRFDLHREPVDMEALVREVAETASILGEYAGLHVSVPVVQPVTILGDRVRLRQLFLNLVTNAIKYSSRGGKVELRLEASEGVAVFTVKDTGLGIAGADLPFVFDRFWRVDRARSRGGERGGVGLGLAISQWIAQAHGGSINVSSRLGRGSTFAVTIPALPEGGVVGEGEAR